MNDPQLDTVQLVIKKLKEKIGFDSPDAKKFTYYDGDPGLIPVFNLPAICVELIRDTTSRSSANEADVVESVLIKVIYNKADDYEKDVSTTNLTQRKILNVIGARDTETERFMPATIKGALVGNLDGDRRIGKTMTVQYGVAPRPEKMITSEGQVTIEVMHSLYTN